MTWYRDGKEIKQGGKYDIVTSLGICSLEIQSSEMDDAGRYLCKAENEKGVEETGCKITINGKVTLFGGRI